MKLDISNSQEFLKNKQVIIATVEKDTINFLKLYNFYKSKINFKIKAIFDLTMPYRPNVKSRLDTVINDIPLITSINDLKSIIEENDVFIDFESLNEEILNKQIEEYNADLFNIEDYENKVKSDYDNFVNNLHCSEFSFVLRQRLKSFFNQWLFRNYNIYIMSGLGFPLYIFDKDTKEFSERAEKYIIQWEQNNENFDIKNSTDYFVRRDSYKQKPIFVFGSDFAIGKSSFLYERLKEGFDIMSPDMYNEFFGNLWYVETKVTNSLDDFIYDALTKRYYTRNISKKEVYIKIEGNLSSFCFPFQRHFDINAFGNIHRYYEDYEFDIIIKENENIDRLKNILSLLCEIHHINKNKVKLFKSINYSESFKDVTSEIDF